MRNQDKPQKKLTTLTTIPLGILQYISLIYDFFPILREILDDLDIPQGMQAIAQTEKHTEWQTLPLID